MARVAVVLFNLGGPDGPEAVKPFLRNLFSDPAILRVPGPLRWFLARLISGRRAPDSIALYGKIGGGSPILGETKSQAAALETALGDGFKSFIAMRYWHPLSQETARAVKDYAPDRIVLLPLYPQFSTSTTASSLRAWDRAAKDVGLTQPVSVVCCYPAMSGFIDAMAAEIRTAYDRLASGGAAPRVLFSAHGVPESYVKAGDPYQHQIETTAQALSAALGIDRLDSQVCYQSRVGPMRWLGPYTDAEIRRAGADRVPVIVVPIAFVSEHVETLVELDMEYRALAQSAGVPAYERVAAVGHGAEFIDGLAGLVRGALNRPDHIASANGSRICPAGLTGCAADF